MSTTLKLILAAVIAGLLILAAYSYQAQGRAELQAEQSAEALKLTKDSLTALSDTLTALKGQLVLAHGRVDTVRLRSNVTVQKASTWSQVADSLRNLAKTDTGQSCPLIQKAYDARSSECALLKVAVQQKDSAIQIGQMALTEATASLLGMQRTTDDLRNQLKIVTKPYVCRILFVPCPSRTVTFFLGAVGGSVLGHVLK